MKAGGRKYIILLVLFALFMVNITFAAAPLSVVTASFGILYFLPITTIHLRSRFSAIRLSEKLIGEKI